MANDMQYFIIAPPIIWLVWRNKKLGLVVIGSLIALSCVIPTVVTYKNGYAPLPTVFDSVISDISLEVAFVLLFWITQ